MEPTGVFNIITQGGSFALLSYLIMFGIPALIKDISLERDAERKEREKDRSEREQKLNTLLAHLASRETDGPGSG